jgi:hypothetical protein
MATATMRLHSPLARAREKQGRGFLARFYAALIEARMRAAMRELARHGHYLSPDMMKDGGYKVTVTNDSALPFTR